MEQINCVFCQNCKYHDSDDHNNYCKSNPGIKTQWYGKQPVYADPSKKNANNGCPEYQPRPLWQMVLGM